MSIEVTNCQYLFGKEANEIFYNVKIQDKKQKDTFINSCLAAMMRVNIFLLSQKDGFFLIDPSAHNNQCHLYALRAAQIKRTYNQKSEKEKLAKTEENRFLHLSFYLSFFLTYKQSNLNFLIEIVNKVLTKEEKPKPKNRFLEFLRDDGKVREKASRQALNVVFKDYMQKTFAARKDESSLFSELYQLSCENLILKTAQDENRAGKLYTFPKLAGVAYLVDTIVKEKFAVAIKVKVITKEGCAGNIVQLSGQPNKGDAVLVLETIATNDSLSLRKIDDQAEKCPSYFYRHDDFKKRHSEDQLCFFCKQLTPTDLQSTRDKVAAITNSFETMFYALGADFMNQMQKEFLPFFADKEKYPVLSKIYEDAVPKIKELGLEMNNPKTFSAVHMSCDEEKEACSEKLLIERPAGVILKERGLV